MRAGGGYGGLGHGGRGGSSSTGGAKVAVGGSIRKRGGLGMRGAQVQVRLATPTVDYSRIVGIQCSDSHDAH